MTIICTGDLCVCHVRDSFVETVRFSVSQQCLKRKHGLTSPYCDDRLWPCLKNWVLLPWSTYNIINMHPFMWVCRKIEYIHQNCLSSRKMMNHQWHLCFSPEFSQKKNRWTSDFLVSPLTSWHAKHRAKPLQDSRLAQSARSTGSIGRLLRSFRPLGGALQPKVVPCCCKTWWSWRCSLVGGWFTPLKNMKVSWDD